MANQTVLHMVKDLKQASKKNDAPIWSKLASLALKTSSSKRVVNLTKINNLTKDGDIIFTIQDTEYLLRKLVEAQIDGREVEQASEVMKKVKELHKCLMGQGVAVNSR